MVEGLGLVDMAGRLAVGFEEELVIVGVVDVLGEFGETKALLEGTGMGVVHEVPCRKPYVQAEIQYPLVNLEDKLELDDLGIRYVLGNSEDSMGVEDVEDQKFLQKQEADDVRVRYFLDNLEDMFGVEDVRSQYLLGHLEHLKVEGRLEWAKVHLVEEYCKDSGSRHSMDRMVAVEQQNLDEY